MRAMIGTALVACSFLLPAAAHAQQAPSWQQSLQGLLSGNQNQDRAVRDAYERGYQRGRQDEARLQAERARSGGYREEGSRYGSQGYPVPRGPDAPPYYNR